MLGITNAESLAGVDNLTNIAVATGGTGYKGTKPTITVPAPTTRTIATSKVSTANTITVDAGHNMRTGTKLTYTSNGTNMTVGGSALAGLVCYQHWFNHCI